MSEGTSPNSREGMRSFRHQKTNTFIFFIILFVILLLQNTVVSFFDTERIPYSDFQKALDSEKIESVRVGEDRIEGEYRTGSPGKPKHFVTNRVDLLLGSELRSHNVTFEGLHESGWVANLFSWIFPPLLFLGFWYYVLRNAASSQGFGSGLLSIGKNKAKIYVEKETKITFSDVAGVDEAKDELKEIVQFLKAPKEYGRLGGRLPKGVLLVGPPGTGKTLLARAVAGEAQVPFFSISGSEFVELFVGVGAARVRDLFEQARQQAPCIIFIDELDALGRARGLGMWSGGHDEKEQTLNQLLAELDGFDPSVGIVLLGATNRPEILDPALLRAGRFDRQILVDRPDKKGRIEILAVHLRKITISSDLNVEEIAAMTPGFTGAELANLVNEAALLATRRGATEVTLTDFTAAVERIVAGLEKKNRLLNPQERNIVAHHEMGHAIAAMSLAHADPVIKVSIIPRGVGALGYTIQRPLDDRFLMSRVELEDKLTVLLAGRAAEKLIFDEISTGSSDDLSRATDIARAMVTRYGMGEKLPLMAYETEPSGILPSVPKMSHANGPLYSPETAHDIDYAVGKIVCDVFDRALTLLTEHKTSLERAAKALLEKETLTREDLKEICPEIG